MSTRKTETARILAKEKVKITFYKIVSLVSGLTPEDLLRWKIYNEAHSIFIQVGCFFLTRADASDAQGAHDLSHGFNFLSGGAMLLNSVLNDPRPEAKSLIPSALQQIEDGLYVIPLYCIEQYGSLEKMLDLVTFPIPRSAASGSNRSAAASSSSASMQVVKPVGSDVPETMWTSDLLHKFTVVVLRKMCVDNGLPSSGIKGDIIMRLIEHQKKLLA